MLDSLNKINNLKLNLNSLDQKKKNLIHKKYEVESNVHLAKESLRKNLNNFTDLIRLLRIPDIDIKFNFDLLFEKANQNNDLIRGKYGRR